MRIAEIGREAELAHADQAALAVHFHRATAGADAADDVTVLVDDRVAAADDAQTMCAHVPSVVSAVAGAETADAVRIHVLPASDPIGTPRVPLGVPSDSRAAGKPAKIRRCMKRPPDARTLILDEPTPCSRGGQGRKGCKWVAGSLVDHVRSQRFVAQETLSVLVHLCECPHVPRVLARIWSGNDENFRWLFTVVALSVMHNVPRVGRPR